MGSPIILLIVEDDLLVRMNIVEALEGDDFFIHHAASYQQALEASSRAGMVDCLLTDVDLGEGLDGLSLAAELRRSRPDLHVIVVSGQRRTMPTNLPGARFFMKPYSASVMAATVREMVLAS